MRDLSSGLPNPRLQRTPSASPPSPLSRQPLGTGNEWRGDSASPRDHSSQRKHAMKMIGAVVLVYSFVSAGVSEASDLVIGQVHLRLGMSQGPTLAALSKDFQPKQVSVFEGKFLLWTRGGTSGVSHSAGSVSFKDGKLYRASKKWGGEVVSDTDDIDGLFSVLAEIAGTGGRVGRVHAETLRTPGTPKLPGSVVKIITIELPPDRKVLLQIYEPSYGASDLQGTKMVKFERSTSVDEFLVDLPLRKRGIEGQR